MVASGNTSLQEITILCFGDSNTYGQKPDEKSRYSALNRWTRQLQEHLLEERATYYVIEEGLGGRRTDLDHPDTTKPSKNGWAYFPPCLASHDPDIVIVLLGTNDAQITHHRSADEISIALQKYIDYCVTQEIIPLLVAPVVPDESGLFNEAIIPKERWNFDAQSVKVLRELPQELYLLSKKNNVPFFDANSCVKPGMDGLHWTSEGHQNFAREIAKIIPNIRTV